MVLILDDDIGATYDCGVSFGLADYCVHFISRTPSLDADKLAAMQKYATDLGLNYNDRPYDEIMQEGCWVD